MLLRRNIYYSLASQWTGVFLSFLTTVFVSRLLTPHEVGIFAIAFATVGLIRTLQDFGTTEYLIQSTTIDTELRRAAFGVTLAAGIATSVLIVLVSSAVADFYETPELMLVMWILAANPLLNALAAPIASMLHRDRQFHKLGVVNAISSAVNTATAIGLAFQGFSYLSLAIGLLAGSLTSLVVQRILGAQYSLWRPSFRNSRTILTFGFKVHLAHVLTYIQFRTTELIIGRTLGISAAAMLHRATIVHKMFAELIDRSLRPVLMAEYGALKRSGGSVAASFLGAMRFLSVIAWPFFGFMALFADEVIYVLFGSQWAAAVVPMQILCIGAAFRPMNGPAMSVLIGTGAVNLNLAIRAATVVVRISAIVVAAFYSLEAVAWASVGSAAFSFVLTTAGAQYKTRFTAGQFVGSLVPSAVVTVVTLLPAVAVLLLLRGTGLPGPVIMFLAALPAGLGWLAGLFVTKHPLWHEVALATRRVSIVLLPSARRRALPGAGE